MDCLNKICKKCLIFKEIEDFYKDSRTKDGYESGCKKCKKKYQEENKVRIRENKKIYYDKNKDILKEYRDEYNSINKEAKRLSSKKWRDKNKEHIKEYYINMTPEQKESQKESYKRWLIRNKDTIRYKKNEYKKNKFKSDIVFALKHNINTLILLKLRNNGYTKKSRTHEILGCSFEELKIYLELKFENWMNWNNRGLYNGEFNYGWDIDHIIPISSGKSEEDIISLNHFSNLQPLCSKINREIKKDKR